MGKSGKRRFEFNMAPYLSELRALGGDTVKASMAAVYAGANVMADAMRKGIDSLLVVSDAHAKAAYATKTPTLISYTQREGLRESLGVARIDKGYRGIFNTRISFDDYNSVKTEKYPGGEPNALIAASCNKGTVGMLKQPFIDRAIKENKEAAEAAMAKAFEEEFEKLTGGN